MGLDLGWSVESESVGWFSLQTLVGKVACFEAPSERHLVAAYADLFGKYLVTYFLS